MSEIATTIECRENGPLVVKNLKSFTLSDGTVAEEKSMIVLCRCGMSKNKPYCDGTHRTEAWSSS